MRLYRVIFALITLHFIVACSKDGNEPEIQDNNITPNFSLDKLGDNDKEVALKPKLSWNAVGDLNRGKFSYDVYLSLKNEELEPIASDLNANEFQMEDKLYLYSEYQWKVVAKDSLGVETSSDISNFTTRNFLNAQLIKESPFPSRITHSVSVYNNEIWVTGGEKPESESSIGEWKRKDVWASVNGIEWTQMENLPTALSSHTSEVFSNELWIIGGAAEAEVENYVFNTIGGDEWIQKNLSESLPNILNHTSSVYNDKIWVIGGENDISDPTYSIWNTDDGENWSQVQDGLDFLGYGSKSIVFNDQLLIISRTDPVSVRVVKEDGTVSELSQNKNLPRYISEFIVYENKIWAFGKSFVEGNETPFQIWNSEDAMTWNLVKEDPNLDVYGPVVLLNDKFYFIASRWATGTTLRDFTSEVWMIE